MSELVSLTDGQAQQLQRLADVWPDYGPALKIDAATSGGMAFRKVGGVDYLTRYTQEDGKKKARSLGRRSPETEAILKRFEETTLRARQVLKENRSDVNLFCRLAKAHNLARLPGPLAEPLEWLWYLDLDRRMSLFGGTALFAYEAKSNALAPASAIRDDHLQFVAPTFEGLPLTEIEEAFDQDDAGTSLTLDDHRVLIRSGDRVLCEILEPRYFLTDLNEDAAEVLSEAFELPPVRGLVFSRDSRALELTALDPRTYALAAFCRREEPIWADRAEFAVEMVTERWPEKFDDHQLDMLDRDPDGGGYRSRLFY
jgi:hypothetical protein